ncbi:LysR family transcriptional regulator [Mycobacterium stomatepiae]|uniref:Probable hydrogen peroxide-inducible genes activator n=1 Tax=Mycobacterium stomatepiae TaxID=470076 RepID=A0A7I7Q0D5_9MYCO|nr:LysR family transcriptional regulator [Mycobacterium stomatepiae]MCV7166210.1 LysR family transcriptional regulator [Mycobacterium stomatepiae]BBY19870.1 putative transcriptional regulator, LysR family protein [Mycobacterium stomatepiae]
MELRQLEYFVAVAAELNFSRAAQRIHVVQSALSASVARLEKELGVELFDRSKRQIVLTPPGEVFLQHARDVIHTAQRAQASVADYRDQLTGTVTLGTLMSWGGLNLAAVLEEFRRLHPLVSVQLRQSLTGSAGHLDAIADGKMDLALVSLSSSPSRLVAVRELTHEPMVFVCESSHALARRRHVSLGNLDGLDFINFPRGWGIRQRLDAGFAEAGVHPTSAYEVADYAIAAELVRHRLAATVLPISAAERFPDLRTIPLSPSLTWTLYLASAASQTGGAVKALVDTITRYVEN